MTPKSPPLREGLGEDVGEFRDLAPRERFRTLYGPARKLCLGKRSKWHGYCSLQLTVLDEDGDK